MQLNRLTSYFDSIPYVPLPSKELEKLCMGFLGKEIEVSYETSFGEIESVSGRLDKFAINKRDLRQNYNFLNLVMDEEDYLFIDGDKMPASLKEYTYGIIKTIKLNNA